MTENNAAQPGLTDELSIAINMLISDAKALAHVKAKGYDASDAERCFQVAQDRLCTLLSKLRAEGVRAGDERAAAYAWETWEENEDRPAYWRENFGRPWWPNWETGAAPQQTKIRNLRPLFDHAALASAPVAGEAIYQIKLPGDTESGWHDATEGAYWTATEKARRIVYAAPQASEAVRIVFPAHLRKMWSGGEVQAWLDEHQGITPPKASARGSMQRYRKWQADRAQSNKVGGDCSKGAGDGQQKYWLCCGSKDPNHPNRRAPDCFNADRAKWGTADQHSVVKQSLTATQTGEKGESDE